MALFDKLKSAFGFGDDPDVDNDPIIGDDPDIESPRSSGDYRNNRARYDDGVRYDGVQRYDTPADGPRHDPATASDDFKLDEMPGPDAIFDKVVAIFNGALPDFLSRTVDPDAERRELYNALDEGMKQYIEKTRATAERNCQRRFDAEKTKLQANIREMENRYRQYDDVRNEMTQKLLSAERQKRAVAERLHDLETKIQTQEAELEQFQLENRSLVNKLKVQGVHEKENQELNEELNTMRAELMRLRASAAAGTDGEGPDPEQLRKDMEKEIRASLEKEVRASLENEVRSSLENDIRAALKQELQADVRKELAESMRPQIEEDIRKEIEKNLTESIREHADANMQKEIERLNGEVKHAEERISQYRNTIQRNIEMQAKSETRLRAENDEMRLLCKSRTEELEGLRRDLAQAQKDLSVAQEKVAQTRAQMQEQAAEMERRIAAATAEKQSQPTAGSGFQKLSETKPNRSETHFESRRRTNKPAAQQTGRNGATTTRTQQRHTLTPIEDILSDTDWVVSPSSLRSGQQSDKPEKNSNRGNDSQLSLF